MAEKKPAGRPEYVPTDEDREKVRVLKAGGMPNHAIAEAIGVSVPTLMKHLSLEIEIGSAKVTAEILMARYRSALGGNVSAQNKMLEQLGAAVPKPRASAPPKLGKKEIAQIEAEEVPLRSGWGDLLQ